MNTIRFLILLLLCVPLHAAVQQTILTTNKLTLSYGLTNSPTLNPTILKLNIAAGTNIVLVTNAGVIEFNVAPTNAATGDDIWLLHTNITTLNMTNSSTIAWSGAGSNVYPYLLNTYQPLHTNLNNLSSNDGSYLTNAVPGGATNLTQFVTFGQLQDSIALNTVRYLTTLASASGFTLTGTIAATNWSSVTLPAQNTNAAVTTANGNYIAAFISTNTFKSFSSGLLHTEIWCFDNVAGSGDITAEFYVVNAVTMAEEYEFTPPPAYQTVPAGSTPTKLTFSTPAIDYSSTTNLHLMVKIKVQESSTPDPTIRIVTGGNYPSHVAFTLPSQNFVGITDDYIETATGTTAEVEVTGTGTAARDITIGLPSNLALGTASFTAITNTGDLMLGTTNVASALAGKQPLDTDLTRIAGIGAGSSGDIIWRDGTGWTNYPVGTLINAGVPNGSGSMVHWSQIVGMPAAFADNTDDLGAPGSGDDVYVNHGNVVHPNFTNAAAAEITWTVAGTNVFPVLDASVTRDTELSGLLNEAAASALYQGTNANLTLLQAYGPTTWQATNANLTLLQAYGPTTWQATNAALTALAGNPQLYQATNAALTALASNPQLYQATNAALTALASNPQLYQATNAALTALAANPQLYQATNNALTRVVALGTTENHMVMMDGTGITNKLVGGDVTLSDGNFTIGGNAVALTTDTTGNYAASVQGTTAEVEVTGVAGEGTTFTLGLPDNLALGTASFTSITNSALDASKLVVSSATKTIVSSTLTEANILTETEAASAYAPIGVDYLVGTASTPLTGEIVVGTTPGGELGGTWSSPTIDDSVTVTGWTLGASVADTAAASDNDTSIATTAFVTGSTVAFTGKTFDAAGTGNVLKQTHHLILQRPDYTDGAGAVLQTNTLGASGLMHATFSGNAETNVNWAVYEFTCPPDLDTGVAMTATFSFLSGGTDTDDYVFHLTYGQVASGTAYPTGTGVASLPIVMTINTVTEANGDIQTSAATTLTGWAAALTPGLPMAIRVARLQNAADDGARDVCLVIAYGSTL